MALIQLMWEGGSNPSILGVVFYIEGLQIHKFLCHCSMIFSNYKECLNVSQPIRITRQGDDITMH